MERDQELADRFEQHRGRLRGLAYRMLGSLDETDDAVQETWLRLERVDALAVDNLAGWLRTVLSRVCLDMLRARRSRREDLVGATVPDGPPRPAGGPDPEAEALLAEAVGGALLVVLDTLSPDERVAFVLHDMFAVPFGEIAAIVGRTTATTKKLASRARHKVDGGPVADAARLARNRRVVEAFLAASRSGDLDTVLTVLAPDVVRRADRAALGPGRPERVEGAATVSREIAHFGAAARHAELALVDGSVGLVIAPLGRLRTVVRLTITDDRVTAYELVADPARLARTHLAVLPDGPLTHDEPVAMPAPAG
ncbi:RNA polymerase subunit sigma-70 [Streptomyces fodineus]|uniref:RNA polymerase subunit sigma-70 n=1 Tax=Streptomyces fodineus TaxID=1904616 RepID=A0A1D7YA16_9ACTN|nr:sigma-70 family RNA polymerase sigma factor [Streptomyces fodineus]AOR32310.1 RNA polymerase subunit sigma-70 [Streptomyces fodineus]